MELDVDLAAVVVVVGCEVVVVGCSRVVVVVGCEVVVVDVVGAVVGGAVVVVGGAVVVVGAIVVVVEVSWADAGDGIIVKSPSMIGAAATTHSTAHSDRWCLSSMRAA